MTVRATLAASLLLTSLAAPVLAQTSAAAAPAPTPTGSLTLMSRPSRASFRLIGDQSIVGRTPMTLDRGLVGRYRVWGEDIGYERWKKTIVLDGVSADTVWMTLARKNALKAGIRSLIFPGWGQFYDDHHGRATIILTAVTLVAGGGIWAQIDYKHRSDDLDHAKAQFAVSPTPENLAAVGHATNRFNDASNVRKGVLIAGATVYGIAFLDAVFAVPHPVGPVLLGADVSASPADGRLAVTVARVNF
jgi:hypothetical protein